MCDENKDVKEDGLKNVCKGKLSVRMALKNIKTDVKK